MSSEGSTSLRRCGNPAGGKECKPHFFKGLPHYNPVLFSNKNQSGATRYLAASLRRLTGVHNVKVPVNRVSTRTGSSVPKEGGAESAALNQVENAARVDKVESPEVVIIHAKKKQKISRKGKDAESDHILRPEDVGLGEGEGSENAEYCVGTYSLKELGDLAATLPREEDWKQMDGFSMSELIKKHLVVWAQSGILLSGSAANAHAQGEKIKELSGQAKRKDYRISELEKELSSLKLSNAEKVSGLENSLKDAGDRASAAETKSGLLEKEVEELKAELGARKPECEVIDAFKRSSEYSTTLVDAAATKILRCWLVAERHIKTDPSSSWDKFIEHYIEAEEAFAKDGTEPEPYEGPNPVLPHAAAVDIQTDPNGSKPVDNANATLDQNQDKLLIFDLFSWD